MICSARPEEREDVAMTYRGYNGAISIEGDVLVLTHEGAVAKLAGLPTNVPRRIPLAAISDVAFHAAGMLSNGWLAVGINGQLAPDLRLSTASASREAVMFRRKDQALFESLHRWLLEVIAFNRGQGAPTSTSTPPVSWPVTEVTASGAERSMTSASHQYQTARPSGRPVDPWAVQREYTAVAGESFHGPALAALFKRRGLSLGDGAELPDATAHLAIDPKNPYDPNAVAVWIDEQHVGFLPQFAAAIYSRALTELAEENCHLTVSARVWASLGWQDESVRGSVSIWLPPVAGVQPFNAFPEEPYLVIPAAKGTIQVIGEERHMEWLSRYVADQPRYLVVSLHLVPAEVGPRSTGYEEVEVRLDGRRVGSLSRQMSAEVGQLVSHAREVGKLPVCRAVLRGSPLRAELTLHVAKSSQVTSRWLQSTARH